MPSVGTARVAFLAQAVSSGDVIHHVLGLRVFRKNCALCIRVPVMTSEPRPGWLVLSHRKRNAECLDWEGYYFAQAVSSSVLLHHLFSLRAYLAPAPVE